MKGYVVGEGTLDQVAYNLIGITTGDNRFIAVPMFTGLVEHAAMIRQLGARIMQPVRVVLVFDFDPDDEHPVVDDENPIPF